MRRAHERISPDGAGPLLESVLLSAFEFLRGNTLRSVVAWVAVAPEFPPVSRAGFASTSPESTRANFAAAVVIFELSIITKHQSYNRLQMKCEVQPVNFSLSLIDENFWTSWSDKISCTVLLKNITGWIYVQDLCTAAFARYELSVLCFYSLGSSAHIPIIFTNK